jgi:hypothetical protein
MHLQHQKPHKMNKKDQIFTRIVLVVIWCLVIMAIHAHLSNNILWRGIFISLGITTIISYFIWVAKTYAKR